MSLNQITTRARIILIKYDQVDGCLKDHYYIVNANRNNTETVYMNYYMTLWGNEAEKYRSVLSKGDIIMVTGTLCPPKVFKNSKGQQRINQEILSPVINDCVFCKKYGGAIYDRYQAQLEEQVQQKKPLSPYEKQLQERMKLATANHEYYAQHSEELDQKYPDMNDGMVYVDPYGVVRCESYNYVYTPYYIKHLSQVPGFTYTADTIPPLPVLEGKEKEEFEKAIADEKKRLNAQINYYDDPSIPF